MDHKWPLAYKLHAFRLGELVIFLSLSRSLEIYIFPEIEGTLEMVPGRVS